MIQRHFLKCRKGKITKKLSKENEVLDLLLSLRKEKDLSEQCISEVTKLVFSNMYARRKGETLIDERVRLYKSMKTKASQAL